MNFIPIKPPLYEDELLYSWINRMISMNGLHKKLFLESYIGLNKIVMDIPDIRSVYVKISNHLYKNNLLNTYMKASTYGFESLFMTQGRQTQYVNAVAREKDKLNYSTRNLFDIIKICPTCKKQDIEKYGEPYLHRSHQYSGICTCHKHGDILHNFCGKAGHECDYNDSDYKQIELKASKNSSDAYTFYVQSVADSGVSGNISDLREIVSNRLNKMRIKYHDGYRQQFLDSYSLWMYKDLFDGDILQFLASKFYAKTRISPIKIIPLLMLLFPQPSQLINLLKGKEPNLLQYQCDKCGDVYIATPQSIREGWGCPSCNRTISLQERFETIVLHIGNGEYIPQSQFISSDKKVAFLHKACGEIVNIKPSIFFFYGSRCICEKNITKSRAERTINAHKGFQLLNFTSSSEQVTILHKDCGRTFTCAYRDFIARPMCRRCRKRYMTSDKYAERVEQYTNGEYSLVGEFKGMAEKVLIRHNICGHEEFYKAGLVSRGFVCKYCREIHEWEDAYNILCSYIKDIKSTHISRECKYNNFSLGAWCVKQKDLRRIGKLTPQQIEMLDNIGFEWSANASKWKRDYNILCLYIRNMKSKRVITKCKYNNFSLGAWCARQKRLRRMGKLTTQQIEMLDNIGFEWDVNASKWEQHYENYKKYIDETGTVYVPKKMRYGGECLGVWLMEQKIKYKKGNLERTRQQKLALINKEFL